MNLSTLLRVALLRKGYIPLPAQYKRPVLKGWPTINVDEACIVEWEREFPAARTTSVRCDNVVAVDIDIDDAELADQITQAALGAIGPSPVRTSRGSRKALLYRGRSPKVFIGPFVRGEETAVVEIRGQGCTLAVDGPHSRGVEYGWDRELPPVSELTPCDDFTRFIATVEEYIRDAGFARVKQESEGTTLHDITEEMIWSTQCGLSLPTPALKQYCASGPIRVCMSPVRPGAESLTTGIASMLDEALLVYDFASQISHMEAPSDMFAELRDLIGEDTSPLPPVRLRGTAVGTGEDRRGTSAGALLPDRLQGRRQPATLRNVVAVMDAMGVRPRWNLCTGEGELWHGDAPLARIAVQHVVDECQTLHGITNTGDVRGILDLLMFDEGRAYHPAEDWIKSAQWDGRTRLGAFLGSLKGPDKGHRDRVLTTALRQVARGICGWRNPVALELVVILVGPQGCGKTSWVRGLLPRGWARDGQTLQLGGWRSGTGMGDVNRQALAQPISELGEVEVLYKRSDIEAIKAFLSAVYDSDRLPYQKFATKRPRTTCFFGTANTMELLHDGSGSRRFLPVEVESIERMDWPEEELQQLWAELWVQVQHGEPCHLTADLDAERQTRAETYAVEAPGIDLLREQLSYRARLLPPAEWSLCGLSTIQDEMGLRSGDPKTNGTMAEWLRRNWHPRQTCLRGRDGNGNKWKAQKCWAMPFKALEGRRPVAEATSQEEVAALIAGVLARLDA